VRAGDAWDRFMRVDVEITKELLRLPYMSSFVDNHAIPIPPIYNPQLKNQPDWATALAKYDAYKQHYKKIGLPLHEFQDPALGLKDYLGWNLDTEQMIIQMRTERKIYILNKLQEYNYQGDCSLQEFEALVGLLSFCAQVLACLRCPLRHFFAR
jgi:hypothetical protein